MSEFEIDVTALAHTVLSTLQTDHSDAGNAAAESAAESLVHLIRAVVRHEVAGAYLENAEQAEAKMRQSAALDERRVYEATRCQATDGSGAQCTQRYWHEDTVSNRAHRY